MKVIDIMLGGIPSPVTVFLVQFSWYELIIVNRTEIEK